jgi:hypothetical protein
MAASIASSEPAKAKPAPGPMYACARAGQASMSHGVRSSPRRNINLFSYPVSAFECERPGAIRGVARMISAVRERKCEPA